MVGTTADFRRFGPPRSLSFSDLPGENSGTAGRIGEVRLNELNATVTAFAYDAGMGLIGKELQTISTEPAGYNGPHSTAEVAVHPSGKFLYASNRGHNSIVGYRIDPSTGLLSVIGFATQGVNFPRNFAIDPSGKWLYVANQKGDTIVQFEIHPETGELKPTGQVTPSITPVAMVFRPAG